MKLTSSIAARDISPPDGSAGVRKHLVPIGLLAIFLCLARVPFVSEARHGLNRDPDEVELTLVTADRLLGVPNADQHWPGGTQQIMLLPVLLLDLLAKSHGRVSPVPLANYLQQLYRQPSHALFLAKLLISVFSSVALAWLYLPFSRILESKWGGVIAVVLLGLNPLVWSYCCMAVSGSNAFCWATLCIALLVEDPTLAFTGMAGGCAGFSLASRTVFLPLLPFALALVLRKQSRWRFPVVFCLCFAVAYFIACPYLWTDPVAFAKAEVGNYLKHGAALGMRFALSQFVLATSPWLTVIFLLSLAAAIVRRMWMLIAGTAISMGSLILPAAHSPMVNSRYFLTMPLIVFVFCIIALGPVVRSWMAIQTPGREGIFAAMFVAAALLIVTLDTRAELGESRVVYASAYQRTRAERRILEVARPNDRVLVPSDVWFEMAGSASSASCRKMAANCEEAAAGGRGLASFAGSFGFSPELIYVFADDFTQKERAFAARMRVMAGVQDKPGLNLLMYDVPASARRFGIVDDQQCIGSFKRGEATILLMDSPIEGERASGVFSDSNGSYYLYQRAGASAD
jgi:hypothetical protein